jgi:hypothetical protein
MARLNYDSDEDFPEISTLINGPKSTQSTCAASKSRTNEATTTNTLIGPRTQNPRKISQSQTASDALVRSAGSVCGGTRPEVELLAGRKRLHQRPWKTANNDQDLLRPWAAPDPQNGSRWDLDELAKPLLRARATRTTPGRRAKTASVKYTLEQEPLKIAEDQHASLEDSSQSSSEMEDSDGMSEFIVDDDEDIEEDVYSSSTPSSPAELDVRKKSEPSERRKDSRKDRSDRKTPTEPGGVNGHARADQFAPSSVDNDPFAVLR